LSIALLLTLDRLSPLERTAFLLHDVFDFSFSEVANALERSEASCRQLAACARTHLRDVRPRGATDPSARSGEIDAKHAQLMSAAHEDESPWPHRARDHPRRWPCSDLKGRTR
jgi:RNA polymerase sigma-70 factor (ECF subfamily)